VSDVSHVTELAMESTHSFSVRASRSAVHTSLAPPNLRGNPLIPLLLDLKNTISFCLFPAYRIFSMRDFDPLHSAIEFDWQLCFVSSFPVVSVGGSAKSSLSGRRQVATLPGHHSCDTALNSALRLFPFSSNVQVSRCCSVAAQDSVSSDFEETPHSFSAQFGRCS
jgi:hypothetical protein